MPHCIQKICFLLLILMLFSVCSHADLQLSAGGKTSYVIVNADHPGSPIGKSVRDLQGILKQITGADFPIVKPQQGIKCRYRIFVRLTPSVRSLLGKITPMQPEERRWLSKGNDIFLYGEGRTGTFSAVYEFLEKELGCRWYTPYGHQRIPRNPNLTVSPFDRSLVPSFLLRDLAERQWKIFNGTPMEKQYREYFRRRRMNGCRDTETIRSVGHVIHTFKSYMPAYPRKRGWGVIRALAGKGYFKDHPEYFSMNKEGKRIATHQICMSNPDMRREFIRNLDLTLAAENPKKERALVEVDQNDFNGRFCWCENCRKLEEKYQSEGGPLYDFLLEISAHFEKHHPNVLIRFLAYYGPTIVPPAGLKKLPANLVPYFAAISGDFSKPWNSSSNQDTYKNLVHWGKLADCMSTWYYSNPFNRPGPCFPLLGNIRRLVTDLRTSYENHIRLLFVEHTPGTVENLGFSGLQQYLLTCLSNNIHQDEQVIIREYLKGCYGKAADLMFSYLHDLENGLEKQSRFLRWNPDQRILQYVTPENILKWEKLFDEMEKLTAGDAEALFMVHNARINLDLNALVLWEDVVRSHPTAAGDLDKIYRRYCRYINEMADHLFGNLKDRTAEKRRESSWKRMLLCGEQLYNLAKGPALPAELKLGKNSTVRQIIPYVNKSCAERDPQSPLGFAVRSNLLEQMPFEFFNYEIMKYQRKVKLPKQELLKKDGYQLYDLGEIVLSPDFQCSVPTFGAGRGFVGVASMGHLFDEKNPKARWQVYVSVRHDKEKKQIFTDRFILIRK